MGVSTSQISNFPAEYDVGRMIRDATLAQPVRGGVDRDGRLVFADDALRKLHHRAGGVEGGVLAIPGLAELALLTHRMKMRLSRSVRVADIEENIELWVEASVEGTVAILSIQSWRSSPTRERLSFTDGGTTQLDTGEGQSILQFDAGLRLISAEGVVAVFLEASDFGCLVDDIFSKIIVDNGKASELEHSVRAQTGFTDRILKSRSGSSISVSGWPKFSENNEFTGYICSFQIIEEKVDARPDTPSSGILFGRQLGPVLRQPLGRIIANAETIGSELNGPIRENYALYAKDIANAARHLVALVDDLGDLEAVERADFTTASDQIELGDVARRVAGLLALKAADHSIRISTPTETQKVPAIAEFRRVIQILLNLVTNAIRYSPDGTELSIDIASLENTSLLTVSDQGAGIAPEDRERVFEKFERLGRSGDGGSGLGLYISRRLARAMGGDLTVDTAANGGAKFILSLPSQ